METVGRNTYHWISEYEDIVHIPTLQPTISQHIFIHYKHTPNLFRKHTLAYQLPPIPLQNILYIEYFYVKEFSYN